MMEATSTGTFYAPRFFIVRRHREALIQPVGFYSTTGGTGSPSGATSDMLACTKDVAKWFSAMLPYRVPNFGNLNYYRDWLNANCVGLWGARGPYEPTFFDTERDAIMFKLFFQEG